MKQIPFGLTDTDQVSYAKARVVILPVPFATAGSWIKGCEKAPEVILETSQKLSFYDLDSDTDVSSLAIHTAAEIKEKKSAARLAEAVDKKVADMLRKKKFPFLLGGDHTISYGAIQAAARQFKKNLTVVHLGATPELQEMDDVSQLRPGAVMTYARTLATTVQIGIRQMTMEERGRLLMDRTVYAEAIRRDGVKKALKSALTKVNENVYLTINMNVLDPALMPDVMHPEPGGPDWHQLLEVIRAIGEHSTIIGADMVEYCPTRNITGRVVSARLLYAVLASRLGKTE